MRRLRAHPHSASVRLFISKAKGALPPWNPRQANGLQRLRLCQGVQGDSVPLVFL